MSSPLIRSVSPVREAVPIAAPVTPPRAVVLAGVILAPREVHAKRPLTPERVRAVICPPTPPKKRAKITDPFLIAAAIVRDRGSFLCRGVQIRFAAVDLPREVHSQFMQFSALFPGQPQVVPGIPNEQVRLKVPRAEIPRCGTNMHLHILRQYGELREIGIPVAEIYNVEDMEACCGYLLVEYIAYEVGEISVEELKALLEQTYEAKICADIKPDNLRRRIPGGQIVIIDFREAEVAPLEMDAEFRSMIRAFFARDPARYDSLRESRVVGHLVPVAEEG